MFFIRNQWVDNPLKLLKSLFFLTGDHVHFCDFGRKVEITRVEIKHLLKDFDGLMMHLVFIIERDQVAVLGQGISNQALFLIEFCETVVDIHPGRFDLLHLLEDCNRLQIKACLRVMFGDSFIFSQGIRITLVTTIQFGKFLSIAHVFGESINQLLIFADCFRNLPFRKKFLGICEKFVFISQGFSLQG